MRRNILPALGASLGRRRPNLARALVALLIAIGWFPIDPPPAEGAEASAVKDHQVKAAFIYNFLKFIEWPAGRFQSAESPIVIGVVGDSPVTGALTTVVKDRKINGREIKVKAIQTAAQAMDFHVVFFAASSDSALDEFLPMLPSGVLTVGESTGFAKKNGMINFVIEDDRVRFEINGDAATEAGLRISAQLQKLARNVRRKQ